MLTMSLTGVLISDLMTLSSLLWLSPPCLSFLLFRYIVTYAPLPLLSCGHMWCSLLSTPSSPLPFPFLPICSKFVPSSVYTVCISIINFYHLSLSLSLPFPPLSLLLPPSLLPHFPLPPSPFLSPSAFFIPLFPLPFSLSQDSPSFS